MKGEYGRVASVWYRYAEGQLPQLKYQYVPKADGTVGSQNVGKRLRSSVDVKNERCTRRVLRRVIKCAYTCVPCHTSSTNARLRSRLELPGGVLLIMAGVGSWSAQKKVTGSGQSHR